MEAERKLAGAGVFKGHEGLRGLAESDSFWEKQPYGTRLYYGDGPFDYLQRGVLKTALKILDTPNRENDMSDNDKAKIKEGAK